MSGQALHKILTDIQKKVRASSAEYRAAESDKRAHFISIDEKLVLADVRLAVAKAMGRKYRNVPDNIKKAVNSGVGKMFTKYKNALAEEVTPNNRKKYFSSNYNLTGNRGNRKLTLVFAVKPEKADAKTNVFDAFKSIKQEAQSQFKNELNDLLNDAGIQNRERTSKRTGEVTTERPIDKNDFLDVGHMGNSPVQMQRVSAARDLLIEGYLKGDATVQKFISELGGSLTFGLDRIAPAKKVGGQEVTEVGLELSGGNRSAVDIPEDFKNLEKDLEDAINEVGTRFAEDDASPSYVDTIEQQIINQFAEMPGRKTGLSKQKARRKNKKASIGKQTKASKGDGLSGATKTGPIKEGKREQRKQSPINLMTLINSKLPQTVRSNMGFPALENQTGRFASSARVVDVSRTPKGFPSVGYTYQRQPYGVFEASSGSRFADPDRDPRTLIDKSIREIAAEMVSGRLFTRRV